MGLGAGLDVLQKRRRHKVSRLSADDLVVCSLFSAFEGRLTFGKKSKSFHRQEVLEEPLWLISKLPEIPVLQFINWVSYGRQTNFMTSKHG